MWRSCAVLIKKLCKKVLVLQTIELKVLECLVLKSWLAALPITSDIIDIDEKGILNLITNLKNNKSPGPDNIRKCGLLDIKLCGSLTLVLTEAACLAIANSKSSKCKLNPIYQLQAVDYNRPTGQSNLIVSPIRLYLQFNERNN